MRYTYTYMIICHGDNMYHLETIQRENFCELITAIGTIAVINYMFIYIKEYAQRIHESTNRRRHN